VKQSKAYPYLKALLDGLIEAAPNWTKAPAKFVASLSEQLKDKGKEDNKQLEEEISSISEEELRKIIEEAGSDQKADLKFIAENIEQIITNIKTVPDISKVMNYRFDKVDEKLEEIAKLLQGKGIVFSIESQKAARDIIQAGRDIIINIQEAPDEKEEKKDKGELDFPLAPGLHNQTPPEVHFVGREGMLETITGWYKSPEVRIGALIGWGGVGKSALVRKWYENLEQNKIRPDGIFWWGFYHNAYLEQFLNALLRYVSGGQIEPDTIKGTWKKVERIKEYIHKGKYLIVLDGLEQMQKGESGDEFGKMLNRELIELLHYLADGPKKERLCLITTRYTMKDLDEWESSGYENLSLTDLGETDAIKMLKNRGVEGDDKQIKEVIKRYKGHALSLTLLAGYLKKHYKGDIEQAPDVEFVLSDKKRFKDVNRLLSKYAEKMTKAERIFLNIFSLFRQDVTEKDFVGVVRHKIKGTKLNKMLINMSELDFRDLVNNLVNWRLISYDNLNNTYTAHPLIKGYFESDFSEKEKKRCHRQVYKHIEGYALHWPETLEEMQPLFEQVYHGCAAGLYNKAQNVVWDKIYRWGEYYICFALGAWETNLSIIRNFFPEGNFSKMPLVSKKSDQSWLLNEAGLALLQTGKPNEAQEILLLSAEMSRDLRDWGEVSNRYQNLAELRFRIGKLEFGVESAEKALEMAKKAKSENNIRLSEGYLGWILYLLGITEEAEKDFRKADESSMRNTGCRLQSIWGSFYAYFLISMNRIDEAFELTKQNMEISKNFYKDSNNISRCHCCLGAIERIESNYKEAENHLQKALEGARKLGQPILEIEAMIELGRLWVDKKKYQKAIREANAVLKNCGRTGFRFYEPDAEIVLGKAYLALKDNEQAESFAQSAYEKAVSMKYRWAEGDAGHLLGEVYLAKGDMAEARKHLEKAVMCRKEILDPNVEESEKLLNDY
jgi:tetratricopeptide (TPR) repeat protein